MSIHSVLRRLAVAAVGVCLVLAAAAARADAVTDEAKSLLAAKQAKAAFDLLSPLEPKRAGDPAFDYLLGIAAIDAGQPTRAIFALERVLTAQPDNALARAEIARAYFAVGETDTAKAEFSALKKGTVPADAVAGIDRYLDAISRIEASKSFRLRGYVEGVIGYDSNVNSATGSNQIAIPVFGGLVVTLDQTGVKQHDTFASIGGGVSLRAPIRPDLAFVANLSGTRLANSRQDRFDTATVDANAGLSYTVDANVFGVSLQANRFLLDNDRFRDAVGVLGQWQHNIDAVSQMSVFGQAGRLTYASQPIRDAHRYVIGAGYARSFGANAPIAYASIYLGREDERAAGVPHLGHELAGLRLGGQWNFRTRYTAFADATLEQRRYGGNEPFFLATRRDEQYSLTFGLHYVPAKDWRITPQVALVRNHSNITLFDFTRGIASVALRREF
jgi:tetratricopeptide (TPR) repeat protein